MKRAVLLLIFGLASSGWAQSLGDVARASREHEKSSKVITNDDLKSEATTPPSDSGDGLTQELDRMRHIFQQICSDPRTDHGRKLSDFDRQEILDGAKPLQAGVNEYERIQKHYKDALAELDQRFEKRLKELWPTGRVATVEDTKRVNSLREEYESQKALLIKQGESELQPYGDLQQDLEAIGKECPEAAKKMAN